MEVSLVLCSLYILMFLEGSPVAQAWKKVLKNDATELIPEYGETGSERLEQANANNNTMNQAKYGGRHWGQDQDVSGMSDFSCRELRSTRYVNDGSCRSVKPVKELVCSGQCLPSYNAISRTKWWRHSRSDYRCVPAHTRTQRIQLECPNQETRTYKIRVVTSCKCKRYSRHHNQSEMKEFGTAQPRSNKNKSSNARIRDATNTFEMQNMY
ncbi:sclerostin [Protopterus annectens]|uniref:sclerostin n=1 Tax=Protopterus annectens TaxID=7888 RepID=UPI001CFB2E34|nr:sclerostin [Protopterus annectens]